MRANRWCNLTIIVITSCSASKYPFIPIDKGSKITCPSYYLEERLLPSLLTTRERIFRDPRACLGTEKTYAFDLYVNAGSAYRAIRRKRYPQIKSFLLNTNDVEWFFLSGGYGIIDAFEEAQSYQASFNYTIAHQNDIPYTAKIWGQSLTAICNAIFARFNPTAIYVFGSKDYTQFINHLPPFNARTRLFESTGTAGPYWVSPILDNLVESILTNSVDCFDEKYPQSLKQKR